MEQKTKRVLERLRSYSIITFGLLLYALGWTVFLIPSGLVGGGVTGISAVIFYATGFPVSWSFFIINAALLAVALKVLGKGFGVKTVFAIVAVTLFLDRLPGLIPQELIEDIAIGNGKLLSAMMGGVFSGAGIAITFTQGGSTGGTDIVALIITKYREMSPGRVFIMCDLVIIGSVFFIPGKTLEDVIYGYIEMVSFSYVIDMVLTGNRQSLQLFIISNKYAEIAEKVTKELGRGVTALDSMGWYSQTESKMLMVILRKTQLQEISAIVKDIDKKAFISVSTVMSVYGQGFDQIKGGKMLWNKKQKES